MKRLLTIFSTFILLLTFFACQATVISTTTSTTLFSETTSISLTENITTTPTPVEPFKPIGYSLLQDELDSIGIPSMGKIRLLVFVVDFIDAPASETGVSLNMIESAFNGSSDLTAFESLRSYYLKSSYGKLDLIADIFGFYRAKHSASYYEEEYDKLYAWNDETNDYLYQEDEVTFPDSDIINELLKYYDEYIDYSEYDFNKDGYIDGLYVIYSTPVSYDYGSDLWWAYQDYYIYTNDVFDGVEANYFCWSGTDFLLEGGRGINARTIIHETGHMLGLDDYYDYDVSDKYNSGGLGGADMMDNSVGDHNPMSKILLGWITPLVVTESMDVNLLPFVDSGETILLINEWKGTIFDEFLLISFYAPTGINFKDRSDIFSIRGVIIYHVNARIGQGYNENSYYYTLFNNNNTDSIFKFIDIIEADADGDIFKYSDAENSDLFQQGDIFRKTIHESYNWHQNQLKMNFTVEIISLTPSQVKIRIEFK
jgi:M6 family metalloprotease-like protein